MGVRAIKAAGHKGDLAGALVVREHEELVFISEGGMVVRQSVRGISRQGRDATGVRVVNIKDDDRVSAVALVVEGSNGDDGDDGEPGDARAAAGAAGRARARRPPGALNGPPRLRRRPRAM